MLLSTFLVTIHITSKILLTSHRAGEFCTLDIHMCPTALLAKVLEPHSRAFEDILNLLRCN